MSFLRRQRTQTHHATRQKGQALAELTICLIILITLILAVTTLSTLSRKQLHFRRDARLEAGTKALSESTQGWVKDEFVEESRSHPMHKVNAYAHLEMYQPVLPSTLPMSNYTLAGRDLPEAELGLFTVQRDEHILLDDSVMQFLYPKGIIRLRESVTFPATDGLWRSSQQPMTP